MEVSPKRCLILDLFVSCSENSYWAVQPSKALPLESGKEEESVPLKHQELMVAEALGLLAVPFSQSVFGFSS